MHELSIAESVVDAITARTGERRVRRVRLRGRPAVRRVRRRVAVLLRAGGHGTPVDGAALEIDELPGRARCATCDEEFVLSDPILLCGCGSSDVRVITGDELRILSVEVAR